MELVSSLGKTTLLLLLQHLLIPGKNDQCQVICQPARDLRLVFLVLWLSFSGSLVAQPVYLSGDDAITPLPLVPVNPPSEIFTSSLPDSPLNWYRLDIELSPYSPHDWLMVFHRVPHTKLDVFIPANNGYQLVKMGIDGFHGDQYHEADAQARGNKKPGIYVMIR